MPSPEAARYLDDVLEHIQRMIAVSSLTLEDQRVVAGGLQRLAATPQGVTWRDASADSVPGIWSLPDDRFVEYPDAVLLFIHGGGFVYGTPVDYRNLVGHIAVAAGAPALTPRYRLAPECPFPAGLEDVVAAYRALRTAGHDARKLVVIGDSAGAGLALGMLMKLRDEGDEMPAAAVLMSPWADLAATGGTMTTNAEVDVLASAEGMRALGGLYAPDSLDHPYASPIEGSFERLCPLMIQAGGHETLLDDSIRVRDKAVAAGVAVDLEVFPEMQHVFQCGAGRMPEADDAVAKVGAYIRSVLAGA